MAATVHPRPFYYLENFSSALTSLTARYADLLSADEHDFIREFAGLPLNARAMLVRMVGRRGCHFRASRLRYAEIGSPREAMVPLIERSWVIPRPPFSCLEVERLFTRAELFRLSTIDMWNGELDDLVYEIAVRPVCDRLRILFFGNFRQEWSEFVLADLGILRYERVSVGADSRAFRSRADIETFYALFRCREQLEQGIEAAEVLASIPEARAGCAWLEARRVKLLFEIGQAMERSGQLAAALDIYDRCDSPEGRVRAVRVLERLDRASDALSRVERACEQRASEVEVQRFRRMRGRLHRKLGTPCEPLRRARSWPTHDIELPGWMATLGVERAVAEHLSTPATRVLFVENLLVNSLLGLLCWEAIFAPVDGAFFHDFHAAPADLLEPDFVARRRDAFAACLTQLDSDRYRETILRVFAAKAGIASPFVAWSSIERETLDLALDCIPASHLRAFFDRVLADIAGNRTGLPDLIEFHPAEQRYRLIEVKGPGDRLQDNQTRWLNYCVTHGIPVAVCKVGWCGL
jgi:hypothetical protein